MNLAFIIILSFSISFAWLYYFKIIDVFENEKFIFIASTFVVGTIIPNVIYPIHDFIYKPLEIHNSGDPVFSFLFFTLAVGLLEECVKIIPVLIVLRFFKPAINEPLDYIKYACVSALGFAFGENIEYAMAYDTTVLISRSVLSVPAHMFFSSIFIYGFVLYKYNNMPSRVIFYYGFLAFIAHGLYDYLLNVEVLFIGFSLTIVLFLFIISAFVNVINNSLNNSPFYTPKKSVDQDKIRSNVALFYVAIIFFIFIYTAVTHSTREFVEIFMQFAFRDFVILFILIVRLSRVSIIPSLWRPVKLEFPMAYNKARDLNDLTIFGLTIKGESYNDYHISLLYEEEIFIVPMSSRKNQVSKVYKGVIEKKLYINEEPAFFSAQ